MNIELFLCRVVTTVMFLLFVRETFYGSVLGTLWCYGCMAFSAWATELLRGLTLDPVELDVWCETCNGSGSVWEEHQIGVIGVGGEHPCPDCGAYGYRKTSAYVRGKT